MTLSQTSLSGVFVLSALSLSSGCNLAPVYEPPGAALPSRYVIPGTQAAPETVATSGSRSRVLDDWRSFHSDPRLVRLIELALANNHDLRLATLNARKVQAQYQVQRRAHFPTIEGLANQTRQRPSGEGDYATVGIGITNYELDLFGRVANLKEAALAAYFSSLANQEAARISLIAAVSSADLSIRANEQALAVSRQMLDDLSRIRALTQQLHDEGAATREALLRQDAELQDTRENIALQTQQLNQGRANLLLMLGLPHWPDTLDTATPPSWQDELPAMPALPAGLPSDLLVRRPDIVMAEHQLRAAHAAIGVARAAFFPRIALTASFGRASSSLSELFDTTTKAWSFIPQLSVPIFDAGVNKANLAAAEADRQLALTQYEKAIQTAFREVATALEAISTQQDALTANTRKLQALERIYQIATTRWENGSISTFEHLATRKALLEARQARIQLQLQAGLNHITLYKALGGGWRMPLANLEAASQPDEGPH